jgi:hypothetical protein
MHMMTYRCACLSHLSDKALMPVDGAVAGMTGGTFYCLKAHLLPTE